MPRNAAPDQHVIDHTRLSRSGCVAIRNDEQKAVATNLAQRLASLLARDAQTGAAHMVRLAVTGCWFELRPVPGGAYAGIFTDYVNDAWRAANCH